MGSALAALMRVPPAAAIVAAVSLLLGIAAPIAAQDGATTASIAPDRLELRESAGVVEIRVSGAPPSSGYQFQLSWDPAVVAVTAVAPGDFLSSAGATLFTPKFIDPGAMVVGEVLPEAPTTGQYPSGSGSLAYVTLAPVGTDASSAIGLIDANLVGPAGEGVPIGVTVAGEVTVVGAPPEPQVAAAAAQATALAEELGSASGLLPSSIADLGDVPRPGSTAIWLGLLAVAVAIVGLGWYLGRGETSDDRA